MVTSLLPPAYPPASPASRILDLLFPPTCVGCRTVGRWICEPCWQGMDWLMEHRCARCGEFVAERACSHPPSDRFPFDEVCVAAQFTGAAREAVHALKYEGRHAISGLMGAVMAEAAQRVDADVVIGVPLHARRRRERGYDQAQMLARAAARRLERPCSTRALKRARYTTQQVTLDAEARYRNVAGAFEAHDEVTGQTVVLVDDVLTTGATMAEAARTLKAAGAARAVALVFATASLGDTV